MGPAPRWPTTALRYLAPITMLLLVAQYLLGLWTNLYAPPAGLTSNSSSPALDWHYNIGFILGIIAILALVLALLSRQLRLAGSASALLVGVLVAGFAGGNFVGTNPNNAVSSFVMGAMFLVAFVAALGLGYGSWMRASPAPSVPPASTPA
ncbi:MAG: hypothetical protein L3K15_08705 [Thermoplasmata archaeon]|nr:hypothetical protein [Thermoplasmata archaeon]